MKKNKRGVVVGIVVFVWSIVFVGCNLWEREGHAPSAPIQEEADQIANYAYMPDGSAIVDGQQINWVVSEWGALPYANWLYVEINQQDAIGKQPGEHQVPVALKNVMLHFSELPNEVSQIVIGVKVVHDEHDQTFAERGRFAVVNGSVSIPVDAADLVSYFGVTHYSVWFQVLGGENGAGVICGQIGLTGVMPSGQRVSVRRPLCVGTNPTPSVATCADGVQNGTETGVDCGGSCPACAPVAPSCADGVKNGAETDVDCGGSCPACVSCTDGVQNGAETGVDCGGSCPACVSCTDGVKNGTETGVDCGGACSTCPDKCPASIQGPRTVGGATWYFGKLGQPCSGVCAAVGLTYDNATLTYAGSSGSEANCKAVATAFAPRNFWDTTGGSGWSCVGGWGCTQMDGGAANWCDTPSTTAAAAHSLMCRFCACQ